MILKTVTGVIGYLFEEAWSKPASIRGHLWTALWWLRGVCFAVVLLLLPLPSFIALGAHLGLYVLGLKPVKLGRRLPYGRRR